MTLLARVACRAQPARMEEGGIMQSETASPTPAETSESALVLHTPLGIFLASLLGGPLGGTLLVASNLWRLGRRSTAWRVLLTGFAAMFLFGALIWWLQSLALRLILLFFLAVGVYIAGSLFLARTLAAREDAGIADDPLPPPLWRSLIPGLICGLLLVAALAGLRFAGPLHAAKDGIWRIPDGPRQEVLYFNRALETDARNLRSALVDAGYFAPGGSRTVLLDMDDHQRRVVSFLVPKEKWNRPDAADALRKLGASLTSCFPHQGLTLRYLDEQWMERTRIDID